MQLRCPPWPFLASWCLALLAERDDDGNESDAFEAPVVQKEEVPYKTFTPEQCDAMAKAKIREVCEPLCCDPVNAQLLLRSYKWDSERLTDGERLHPPQTARALAADCPLPARLPCRRNSARLREPCSWL